MLSVLFVLSRRLGGSCCRHQCVCNTYTRKTAPQRVGALFLVKYNKGVAAKCGHNVFMIKGVAKCDCDQMDNFLGDLLGILEKIIHC